MSVPEFSVLHKTTAGLKPFLVDVAPPPPSSLPPSKRNHLIDSSDRELDGNLTELDEGTRARNRAFQARLDEVLSLIGGWEGKLKKEARDAAESITDMRDKYQREIDQLNLSLQIEIKECFDKLDLELIPEQGERVTDIDVRRGVFVDKTVPAAIESQSGVVSRELKKAFETFDISKQKEHKRELKIVAKASEHILNTAQRFNDETALMAANLFLLEDDVVEAQRRSARMAEVVWDRSINQVRDVKDVIAKESDIRGKEDADLLDTVIETQQMLQEMVLEYFGSGAEGGEGKEGGKGKAGKGKGLGKLSEKMEKIEAKKKAGGGGVRVRVSEEKTANSSSVVDEEKSSSSTAE